MNRIALIPAYEPDEIIEKIVNELRENDFEVIVVDDGSGPKYKDVFEHLRDFATVISYPENQGKGYALKEGMKFISQNYASGTVVTLDADGQHLVSDVIRVCSEAECGSAGLAIGAREISKDCPRKSRLGNSITRLVYRLVTGVKVRDTQSGLRAFSVSMVSAMLQIPGNRYEYEMNVLLQLAKQGIAMKEIPIETIYFDKQNSVSHFNALSDSVKIYVEILKYIGSSLFSFLIDYGIYSLMLALLGAAEPMLLVANVSARAVSSICNFTINKKLVFRSKGNVWHEALRYFGLVVFVLCVNSVFLAGFTLMGCNAFIAKIIVECIMFVFNYLIQHFLIFQRKGAKVCDESL